MKELAESLRLFRMLVFSTAGSVGGVGRVERLAVGRWLGQDTSVESRARMKQRDS